MEIQIRGLCMSDELNVGLERQLGALAGRKNAGWKVGLTSGQARDSMGPGFRPFGYILPERVFSTGAELPFSGPGVLGLENELCFRFRRDVRMDADRDEVIAALAAVAPAFEINEQRLGADSTPKQRLEDNLSQWGIVVGEGRELDWRAFPFESLVVDLMCDGEKIETVAAKDHIDDHIDSLVALVRTLARFDRSIEGGNLVITGSYTRQRIAQVGHWRGDFGPVIGEVEVVFS